MTNPDRNDYEGSWHHWINRGARRQPTFLCEQDRRSFLRLLGAIRSRYGVETHAYALMTNHHHVLVRSLEGNLSRAIQFFASCYTREFNRRHGFDGPQCRARFKSVPVLGTPQLAQAARYIHRNPFSLDPTVALSDHRWSSFRAYTGHTMGPAWLRQRALLELYGDSRHRLRDHVEQPQPGDEFDITVPSTVIDRPVADDRHFSLPALGQVQAAVAHALESQEADRISRNLPRPSTDRMLTIQIAQTDAFAEIADCADHFGLSLKAIQSLAYRSRKLLRTEARYVEAHDRARRILGRQA